MSELLPCPFCGKTEIIFMDSEDWGYICCDSCCGSVCVPLDDLPGYDEMNDTISGINPDDPVVQPLAEAWNTRTANQKIKELEEALHLQNRRLAVYVRAVNQIDDYFEYQMESKKDQKKVHQILGNLTDSLPT